LRLHFDTRGSCTWEDRLYGANVKIILLVKFMKCMSVFILNLRTKLDKPFTVTLGPVVAGKN
jgi:hypothetical protein